MAGDEQIVSRKARLTGSMHAHRQESLPRQLAEACIAGFYRAFRGLMYYDRSNSILERTITDYLHTVNTVTRSAGMTEIKIVSDTCYLNGVRVHVSAETYTLCKGFVQEMRKLWLGEVEFSGEVSEQQLVEFFLLLRQLDANNESNFLLLKKQLAECGITNIDVGKLEGYQDGLHFIDSDTLRRQSKDIYFTTLALVKDLMGDSDNQNMGQIRRAKRLMLKTVDVMMKDESALLGLTNIKCYDDYTFTHSVNVAIYAVALGQRLGIPKKHLNYLGMTGLFHDIGKTGIDKDVMNKTGLLSDEEWEIIKTHPMRGAELIMKARGWGELSTRMMAVAFEHHIGYDLSGYPQLIHPRRPSLFSRIISLADVYDALGRPRVYRDKPFVSEKIIALLLEQSGKEFDPALVKVFINMIGLYPLGTLVLLNTGEMGIITRIPDDAALINRPQVLLLDRDHDGYRRGPTVNLADVAPDGADYTRSIVRTLDPNEYRLNIEEFFI